MFRYAILPIFGIFGDNYGQNAVCLAAGNFTCEEENFLRFGSVWKGPGKAYF